MSLIESIVLEWKDNPQNFKVAIKKYPYGIFVKKDIILEHTTKKIRVEQKTILSSKLYTFYVNGVKKLTNTDFTKEEIGAIDTLFDVVASSNNELNIKNLKINELDSIEVNNNIDMKC